MSLTGTTIYMLDYGRPLRMRLEERKTCGPYEWTVSAPGRCHGRGFYASDDAGNTESRDSTFRLRAAQRQGRDAGTYFENHDEPQRFYPIVLRLNHGRGFLAGWSMGTGMASEIGACIWAEEAHAWASADSQAERVCEAEAAYQAKERERAEDKEAQEAALDNLADCHPPLFA